MESTSQYSQKCKDSWFTLGGDVWGWRCLRVARGNCDSFFYTLFHFPSSSMEPMSISWCCKVWLQERLSQSKLRPQIWWNTGLKMISILRLVFYFILFIYFFIYLFLFWFWFWLNLFFPFVLLPSAFLGWTCCDAEVAWLWKWNTRRSWATNTWSTCETSWSIWTALPPCLRTTGREKRAPSMICWWCGQSVSWSSLLDLPVMWWSRTFWSGSTLLTQVRFLFFFGHHHLYSSIMVTGQVVSMSFFSSCIVLLLQRNLRQKRPRSYLPLICWRRMMGAKPSGLTCFGQKTLFFWKTPPQIPTPPLNPNPNPNFPPIPIMSPIEWM